MMDVLPGLDPGFKDLNHVLLSYSGTAAVVLSY